MTTLDTGQSLDQKYKNRLGTTGQACIPPPTQTSMLIIGPSNEGKSCFLQSCPDAFIINSDASSTTNPDVKAHIWPAVGSEDGRLYDYPGGPEITLTWAAILERIELLCDMARDKWEKRPKLVAIDTIDTCIRLAREHVLTHAHELGLVAENRPAPRSWNDMNGKAAWDVAYTQITDIHHKLRSHGYGVIYTLHLVKEKIIQLTEDQAATQRNVPRVTDNFWGRLYPEFEVIAVIQKQKLQERREVPQYKDPVTKEPLMDAKTGKQKVKVQTVTRDAYCLSFNESNLIKKRRRALSNTIPLSPTDGWSDYAKAYDEAIANENKEINSND